MEIIREKRSKPNYIKGTCVCVCVLAGGTHLTNFEG